MNNIKGVVIFIILLVLILISINGIGREREKFIDHEKTRVIYHVFKDFKPELKEHKFVNYLPDRQILNEFNRSLADSDLQDIESVNSCGISSSRFDPEIRKESIYRNLSNYFKNQQEKFNVESGVENEINSTALILSRISKYDLNNNKTKNVLKFVLMNTIDNYKLERDSSDILHFVFLPFVLKDANVIKVYYLDKEIFFIGLYTPKDNSKFFNSYPRWHDNKESMEKIKGSLYNYMGIEIDIPTKDNRYIGMYDKCEYLNNLCNAGIDCEYYNELMINNIESSNRQISAYNNYLRTLRNTTDFQDPSRSRCPETVDTPPSNLNSKFSFI